MTAFSRNTGLWILTTSENTLGSSMTLKQTGICIQNMTMPQLQQLHTAILSEDAEFIAAVKVFADEKRQRDAYREKLDGLCERVQETLIDRFCQSHSKYSDRFKTVSAIFCLAANENGFEDFEIDSYKFNVSRPETFEAAIAVVEGVLEALDTDAPWVVTVSESLQKSIKANREKLVEKWIKARHDLHLALDGYRRDLDLTEFYYKLDKELYINSGTMSKVMQEQYPSSRTHDDTIREHLEYFKKGRKALKTDANWLKAVRTVKGEPAAAMPPEPPPVETESEDREVYFIRMVWGASRQVTFEHNTKSKTVLKSLKCLKRCSSNSLQSQNPI